MTKTAFAIALGLLALVSMPAAARPRDDVMSGAFRCAAIGDSRVWLDCYYGAAQPVRAALGLKPVSDAQQRLVSAPPSGQVPPGDNAVRDQVMSEAFRCTSLGEDRAWLDCYYGSAQPMRARLGLVAAPQARMTAPIPSGAAFASAASPGQPSWNNQRETDFGNKVSPLGNVDHISVPMQAYTFDKLGWFTATLSNGQVWRQVNGDTSYAKWKKPAGRYLVRISKGFLGSFNLQVKGEPGLFKVLRVQ